MVFSYLKVVNSLITNELCAAVANVSKIIINVFAGHGPSNMHGALPPAVAPLTAARCTFVNSWALG